MFKKPDSFDLEQDSEDDLYEMDLEFGAKVDYYDDEINSWMSGTIINSIGESSIT